jgi:hypothetical protein
VSSQKRRQRGGCCSTPCTPCLSRCIRCARHLSLVRSVVCALPLGVPHVVPSVVGGPSNTHAARTREDRLACDGLRPQRRSARADSRRGPARIPRGQPRQRCVSACNCGRISAARQRCAAGAQREATRTSTERYATQVLKHSTVLMGTLRRLGRTTRKSAERNSTERNSPQSYSSRQRKYARSILVKRHRGHRSREPHKVRHILRGRTGV